LPREAATARAQVGVLRYPYLSTPTGAPGPGPHTVPSAVGPGPKQCTGTRGPRRAESTSISAAPHGNGTRRLRRRGMGRAHDLLMERGKRPPLPHKSRGNGRGSPPCALITSSSSCKKIPSCAPPPQLRRRLARRPLPAAASAMAPKTDKGKAEKSKKEK